jgi:4-hydroxythreonine-4-phosphate dehydrogenase
MVGNFMAIGLTYGDPAGIGPEILARLLADQARAGRAIVYGDRRVLAAGAAVAGVSVPYDACEFVEVPWEGALPEWGKEERRCGEHVMAVLKRLGADLQRQARRAVVTGPVHKGVVRQVEAAFIGHTEFFAQVAGVERYGMLLVVEPLRALHVTTHVALRDVPALLTPERIGRTLDLAAEALEMLGEPGRPIGVCGLNPHAGEGGAFGDEEIHLIGPAIAAAKARGIDAVGPLSPDAAFPIAAGGVFGVVVCMYHDQGHVPLKLLGMTRGINVTVGLPFIRTSVDHGTAFDIAGRGVADAGSFRAAWDLACRLAGPFAEDDTSNKPS